MKLQVTDHIPYHTMVSENDQLSQILTWQNLRFDRVTHSHIVQSVCEKYNLACTPLTNSSEKVYQVYDMCRHCTYLQIRVLTKHNYIKLC